MGSLPFGDFKIIRGFPEDVGFGGLGMAASALVLDEERGQLVTPSAMVGKKGTVSEARVAMALKSHSEAERRRRERINAHLSTLRKLVPSTDKLDKAALLAEVISHVRELKNSATEISKGCNIPVYVDEVKVEVDRDGTINGRFTIKASLCSEDRPELLADLKQMLQAFQLKIVRAEISTLGGRVKIVFLMNCEGNGNDSEHRLFVSSIHQALKSVIDRVSSPPDFSPMSSPFGKRQRISPFGSSSFSC